MTAPGNRWKKYREDLKGNLWQVEEPNPKGGAAYVTTYTHDDDGRVTKVEMPRSHHVTGTVVTQVREFVYDAGGKLTETRLPETGTTKYTYHPEKKYRTEKLDARGWKSVYEYDDYSRLKMVKRIGADGQERLNDRVEYYWDAVPTELYDGTAFTLPSGVPFTGWAMAGRLAMTRTGAPGTPGTPPTPAVSRVIELFAYTAGGQVARKRMEAGGRKLEVSYGFDTQGRVASAAYPSGRTFLYEWTDGRQTTLKEQLNGYPAAVRGTVAFDARGRLSQVKDGLGVAFEEFGYDEFSRILSYKQGPTTWSYGYTHAGGYQDGKLAVLVDGASTTTYGYDQLGRLTSAARTGPGAYTQGFEYDGFGNLFAKTTNGVREDRGARLDAATNRLTEGGSFDAAGNHVWNTAVEYDHENRVRKLPGTVGGTVAEYEYTPDNKRVWDGRRLEWTLWVGSVKIGSYKYETVEGTPKFTGTEYVYLSGRRYTTMVESTPPSWPVVHSVVPEGSDRLGSGAPGHRAYGEDTGKFATYSEDAGTGLDYADQRYYLKGWGRFMTADPYLPSGGSESPGSWNRYAYVEGDPVNYNDPSGFEICFVNRTTGAIDQCWSPPTRVEVTASQIFIGFHRSSFIDGPRIQAVDQIDNGESTGVYCGGTPPGPTVDTLQNNLNAATAVRRDMVKRMQNGEDALAVVAGAALWFYEQVRNRGPWDYKQQGPYEAFGNVNFGATGAALGFDADFLTRMAGWAQRRAETSIDDPSFGTPGWLAVIGGYPPYGDDPVDYWNIQRGVSYFEQRERGCL